MQLTPVGLVARLALALLAVALVAEAQQPTHVHRLGVLSPYKPPAEAEGQPAHLLSLRDALRQGLRERGWIEGQTLTLEERHAAGQVERLPALAAEMVQLPVDVLFAIGDSAAQAAQHATRTIPIVFVWVADPVLSGLVASLAQPGANVTGTTLTPTRDINEKRLELLTEAVPQVSRLAVLWNPAHPLHPSFLSALEKAARKLEVALHAQAMRDPTELERAFHAITDAQANGLYIPGDPMLDMQDRRIVQFALAQRLPTMFLSGGPVRLGALMAYGPEGADLNRRTVALVDKVLRGAKPVDLPVEQPRKFKLVINLKTAEALGITIPPTLLFQADEVIK